MSNNTTLNAGTGGDVIADEDVAGVKYQLIKLVDSTATSTTRTGVSANPLRVDPTGTTTQPVSAASLPLPTGAATAANQTSGSQQSQLTDGTNVANVLKSDGTYAGTGAALTAGSGQATTSLSAGALNADLIPATDVTGYKSATLFTYGTFTATITVQGSNDNFVNHTSTLNIQIVNGSTAALTSGVITTSSMINIPLVTKYLRVRVTAYTSGTVNGAAYYSTYAFPALSNAAVQSGTWTVGSNSATGSAVPANAFYAGVKNSGGNLDAARFLSTSADGVTTTAGGNVQETLAEGWNFNGTTWDRQRSANAVAGTTGTGLLGTGTLVFDGTNWQKVSATNPMPTYQLAPTGNGFMPSHYISAATTNATNVKASAGDIGGIQAYNNSATVYYLKIYDKATAPTVGTDTPVKTIVIPANTSGAGSNISFASPGISCLNGISFAITGGIADADTTACAASAVVINLDTK